MTTSHQYSDAPKVVFAVFPYLRSEGTFTYRRIGFFSNTSEEMPARFAADVKSLAAMFFLRDNLRLVNLTFAAFEYRNDSELAYFTNVIAEFQAIITFFYTLADPVRDRAFLTEQHCTLYVLQPSSVFRGLLSRSRSQFTAA